MKKIIVFLLISVITNAQEYNIWHFGTRAGLDFNQGSPIAISGGQIFTQEGCASISDSNGNLLFYTDGRRVWNKNHQVMENGTGLNGHTSSTQSALIIPKPGSSSVYYIFTTTATGGPDGLCYSVVDMEGAAGLGAIIEKNTLLHTPSCEKLAAAWHINGTDIWVMSHEFGNDVFAAYLITPNGINTTPITSSVGVIPEADGAGHLKFSPNGNRLVMTSRYKLTQLFDFDPATGIVENPVSLAESNYGVEFSASGNVLYVSTNSLQEISLYQYNLQAADIMGSATELLSVNLPGSPGSRIGALQRGPDNKIYVAHYQSQNLSVVNLPDIPGTGCDLTENSLSLINGSLVSCQHGLPNNSLAPAYWVNIGHQPSCAGQESVFWVTSPQGAPDTVLWEFGDGSSSTAHNPTKTFFHSGTYLVRLTVTRQGIKRVVETDIEIINSIDINPAVAMVSCETNQGTALFDLSAQNTAILGSLDPNNYLITYHTSLQHAEAGSNSLPTDYNNTSNPETIYLRVEAIGSGCFALASFELIVEPSPVIDMHDSYTLCTGSTLVLTAPDGFNSYLWSTGETSQSIVISQVGSYTITVTQDQLLCENTKTITVYESEPPIISQIKINDWTDNQNTITVFVTGIGQYEYSLDDMTYQDSPIFTGLNSGLYTVFVRDKNYCGTIIQEVVLFMYPKFFTPNGDGFNDRWAINHSWFEPEMKIYIFDRYGKLITFFTGNSPGWDGNYNGRKLPATDYWFRVERKEGMLFTGHFSLVR